MKTKHNVFVPVGSQQEAERMEKVLRAMGEEMSIFGKWDKSKIEKGGLYFNKDFKNWCYAENFSPIENEYSEITFGELIDILSKPEKIAVKVENEREFKALMKYYDGLGWKSYSGGNPLKTSFVVGYWTYEDNFGYSYEDYYKAKGFITIPFQQFAKEHNIKVPLYVNIVGDEFYQDSPCFWIYKFDGKWMPGTECGFDSCHISMIEKSINKECQTPFPTKESALKWIEEQKPKEVIISPESTYPLIVTKDKASIDVSKKPTPDGNIDISKNELIQALKAMEELK